MEMPNPRVEYDNLATVYAWARNIASPDVNPYRTPEEFLADYLRKCYPSEQEMLSAVENWPVDGLADRVQASLSWCDDLYAAVADQMEAPGILSERMPLRTLYLLNHGVHVYSTKPFGDPWDSGPIGFAFVEPSVAAENGLGANAQLSIVDAEVDEYSRYVNGEYDEEEDWSDYTGLRCPECGNTREFQATDVQLTGRTVITPDGWDWTIEPNDADFAPGCHVICSECGHEDAVGAFSTAEPAPQAPQPPIGAVIVKGACAVDAKGADVFCGDIVVDSFCAEHRVVALEPIDADHCWLVDEEKTRLIPHLVEKAMR